MELSPDWVVGFVDGEGCFYVGVNRQPEMTVGYQVLPEFRVVQHKRDIAVLYSMKRFFQHGVVRQNHEDRWELRIRKQEGLRDVVRFFERHPLKTKKNADFKSFAHVIRWMDAGQHLTGSGLIRIVDTAMRMNRAVSETLTVIRQEILERTKIESSPL